MRVAQVERESTGTISLTLEWDDGSRLPPAPAACFNESSREAAGNKHDSTADVASTKFHTFSQNWPFCVEKCGIPETLSVWLSQFNGGYLMTGRPLESNSFPTILLVEVDDTRRLALATVLRTDEYLVLEAEDVSSAMELARMHSRPIHLLVMSDSFDPSLPDLLKPYRPNLHVFKVASDQNGLDLKSVLENVRQFFTSRRKTGLAAGTQGSAA